MCCMQVILSSSAHKRGNVQLHDLDFKKSGYDQWASYGQSKTANIWTALEIERRYGSQGQWWCLSFLSHFQCSWHRHGLMLLADPTYASVAVTVLMPAWKSFMVESASSIRATTVFYAMSKFCYFP